MKKTLLLVLFSLCLHHVAFGEIHGVYPYMEDNSDGSMMTSPNGESVTNTSVANLSTGYNYILSLTPTIAVSTAANLTIDQSLQTVQYFDGLGRLQQTIQVQASPDKRDLVTYQEYDVFGRESHTWLPAVASGNNGAFVPFTSFTGKATATYPGEARPYVTPIYENSPLNRILKQYGPGQDWYDNRKCIGTAYLANQEGNDTLNCIRYTAVQVPTDTLLTLIRVGNYASNQLYVTHTWDEDGHTTFEFRNKLDQVVLIRQIQRNSTTKEMYDTYYIYDDYGNLMAVLPPIASDIFRLNHISVRDSRSDATLKNYAYLYRYDHFNRQTAVKLPGCSWSLFIYDKADRLIFSQNGEERIRGEWLFTIPDALGRIVLTGLCSHNLNPLSSTFSLTVTVTATRNNTNSQYKGYTVLGIALGNPQLLTVNYYDNYEFLNKAAIPEFNNNNFVFGTVAGFTGSYHITPKASLTGTLTARLEGAFPSSFLSNVMYYDTRMRTIQTVSGNHLGGLDKEYITYTFVGNPEKRRHVHNVPGKTTLTEDYVYTYDHAGRLLKTTHQLTETTTGGVNTSKPLVVLAENTYDQLGRLNTTTSANQFNLRTDYTYTIRSWIQHINSFYFQENLVYTFNGNVKSQEWRQADKTRKYTFDYDHLSRLKSANYNGGGNYTTAYLYDKHGNMTSLQRYGNTGTMTYGIIDNLTLTYNGNQLIKVEDTGVIPTLSSSADFRNGSSAAVEYFYDTNGSMKKDLNKGINLIEYNSLNLPKTLTISNSLGSATNTYMYNAAGARLRVTKGVFQTDYVGNVIYENNIFKRLLIDGGYYEGGIYYFYVRDHLGNNRIVADQNAGIVQSIQYYPFGMTFADALSPNKQPYKFGNKELDTDRGLNLYDFLARQLSELGRFTTMDPMAEDYYGWSPYVYCLNNPVKYIDPNGLSPIYDMDGNFLGTDDRGLQGLAIMMAKENFIQNMSHLDAMSYYTHNDNKDAFQKMLDHYTNLDKRPDFDGFVTVNEGIEWAKNNPGALQNPTPDNALYINSALLDFGNLKTSDFISVGEIKPVNLLNSANMWNSIANARLRATVYALGRVNIILENRENGIISVVNDEATDYDWNRGGGTLRSTLIDYERANKGLDNRHGFRTVYYGKGRIKAK